MGPSPCLELIGKLIQFIQIDARLKSEIVRAGRDLFAWGSELFLGNATAQGGVDHFLETKPLFLGFAQENGGEIIIQSQGSSHSS